MRVAVIYPAPFVIALLLRDMFADPSKLTPAIVLAVSKAVAVAALPVVSWLSVAILAAAIVPELMLLPFNDDKDAPDPLNVVAVQVPVTVNPPETTSAFVDPQVVILSYLFQHH